MKIITYGKFGKDLSDKYKNSDLKIDYYDKIDQEILDQYDSIAAFSPPKDLDISHIYWIHSFAAGVDPFAGRQDLAEDLEITKSIGEMDRKMAEYCLNQILMDAQKSLAVWEKQQQNEWFRLPPKQIKDQKVAILGTGYMGKGIARLLESVGMDVVGVNSDGREINGFRRVVTISDLKTLNTQIDIIISTLPITDNSYHLLDNDFFSSFKNIHFINCGRGKVVNSTDLITALENGYVRLASLDVFEKEPLPDDSELWQNSRIIITPHQASLTSLTDVLDSFEIALDAIINSRKCDLRADVKRGY